MKRTLFSAAAGLAVPLLAVAVVGLPRFTSPEAAAAQGSGAVVGQVLWCAPFGVRVGAEGVELLPAPAIAPEGVETFPAPGMAPGIEILPAPGVAPEGVPGAPGVGIGPVPPRPIPVPRPQPVPAGAVLVAVQGTGLSARTDETGRFRIEGVPVGQYYTVAAGPVRTVPGSTAMQPNVFVASSGQTVDLGRLGLAGPCPIGPVPLGVPGAAEGQPGELPPAPGP